MLEVTQTANQTVVISTDPVLTSYYDENLEPDAIIPLSGSIEMLAEDGSFLYMNSEPAAAPTGPFQFYRVNGIHENVDFVEKPVDAQSCE